MKLLVIDTSTKPLTVAIAEDYKVLAEAHESNLRSHSVNLLPDIQKILAEVNLKQNQIDRVVIAQGPGSYTGIRIGVTTAKVLAWTLNKELVGVSSLEVLARNIHDFDGFIVPFFDARNGNVFAGVYEENKNDELKSVVDDQHVPMASLLEQVKDSDKKVRFIGQGMSVYRQEIIDTLGDRASFEEDNVPKGSSLVELGLNGQLVKNLDGFVPNYLRKTQAEMVWLKTHTPERNAKYVQDV